MSSKGKAIATGKAPAGKRKSPGDGDKDRGKRKKSGALKFFEDAAYEVDEEEEEDSFDLSDLDDDFLEDEFGTNMKVKTEPGLSSELPFAPKEEVLDEEEFDRMMEERYKDGSMVRYAEDRYRMTAPTDRDSLVPSAKDPVVWKVKCMVGRERQSAFCLMQKYVDLKPLGTKLQIISAFVVEHVKGFIFMEAEKQFDIVEACKGLSTIYTSRIAPIPKSEISNLLSVRSKHSEVSAGMWVRVKNGKYKGDLAQIVSVNDARRRATVKLIPRIDLQALAEKFGGGASVKKGVNPAPRLISTSELEEFRPLIQRRLDRDTELYLEVLDGQMLKDGFLYKRVSLESLSCWGANPSEDELLKFSTSSRNDDSGDLEWLSQIYGDQKKKNTIRPSTSGGKGEGSSSGSSVDDSFELYDFVCFGRKDFGVIIGMEKDDSYKILKEGPEGSIVATAKKQELKKGPSDIKFTALDKGRKAVAINDSVKVLEGPAEGRQGIVKVVYRGIIFAYDANEVENGGYFCFKSQICEKIKFSSDACAGKGGESAITGFEDPSSSPKSPLSPKRSWQTRETSREFRQQDKDGMFSIGQTLRIRVGPLKGYLCRVLAIRRSDVTVKLNSQQKTLLVKREHLAEVRAKGSCSQSSDDPEAGSGRTYGWLETGGSSGGWTNGAGTSAEGERSSWPSFPASGAMLDSNSANPLDSVSNGTQKDAEDGAWGQKPNQDQNTSWGAMADAVTGNQTDGWGKSEGGWNKGTSNTGASSSSGCDDAWASKAEAAGSKESEGGWGKAKLSSESSLDPSSDATTTWGKKKDGGNNLDTRKNSEDTWNKKNATSNAAGGWSNVDTGAKGNDAVETDAWEKNKYSSTGSGSAWGKAVETSKKIGDSSTEDSSWSKAAEKWSDKKTPENESGGWGNACQVAPPAEENSGGAGNWGKTKLGEHQTGTWGKDGDGGFSWGKKSNWNSESGSKEGDGGSSWDNKSSWKSGTSDGGRNQDGSWGKKGNWNSESGNKEGEGGSSWGNKSSWKSGTSDGGGNQDGGWGKKSDRDMEFSSKDREGCPSWGSKSSWKSGTSDGGENQDGKWSSGTGSKGNDDSSWTKKSSWKSGTSDGGENQDGKWSSGTGGKGNDGSSWTKKSSWNSESGGKEGDGVSGWGGKSSWKPGTSDSGVNQDGGWGKKRAWDSDSGNKEADGGSNWGNKSSWKSGTCDGGGDQNGGWGKKGNWNSGSGSKEGDGGSSWGNKSSWSSGKSFGGSDSMGGGSGDPVESFNDRGGGGNWRGSFGGRSGSDRGGFRGRGRFGGRGGGDRGFGGRDESGRGRFGGRGDRGGFGGRGRGRRDQGGNWSNRDNSDDGKSFSWNKETGGSGEGFKGDKGNWSSWNPRSGGTSSGAGTWGSKGSSWSQQAEKGSGGSAAGGWGKESGSGDKCQSSSWNQQAGKASGSSATGGWGKETEGTSGATDKGQWSSWNQQAEKASGSSATGGWGKENVGASGATDQLSSWKKASAAGEAEASNGKGGWGAGPGSSSAQSGGWSTQGSDREREDGSVDAKNQSVAADGGQSSSWNQSDNAWKGTAGEGEPTNSWGKAPESSWK